MSVLRIYPTKDAFIVSGSTASSKINTGLDEILELGLCDVGTTEQGIARILLDFSWSQVPASASSVHLHLVSSTVSNLKEDTTIQLYNQIIPWDRGTGHIYDVPNPSDGATWNYPTKYSSINWNGAVVPGSIPVCEHHILGKDIDVDITEHYSTLSSIVLKLKDESTDTRLSYFSSDTHTIYRPYAEILVDDSVRSEHAPEIISESRVVVSAKGLKESYTYGDKIRLDLGVRPQFPRRTFSTSSLYLDNYTLPVESYWSIEDNYTGEVAISSSIGTKISADEKGSYFMLDMGLLEPERFYNISVHTNISNQKLTLNVASFKVSRNGRE